MFDQIIVLVQSYATAHPTLLPILSALYLTGLGFRTVRGAAEKFVSDSHDKASEAYLAKIESSVVFKYVAMAADFLFRLKI